MRKSQVSVQFHWIFIVIAGAIILGFFIGIALKQKTISEKQLAGEVMEELNQIFAGAGASEETSIKIDIPDIEIEFSCKAGVSMYSIKDSGASKDTTYDIIFAPDLVKGESLVTWALPWKMPFNVQNFLMVTSPSVRYIFIYKNGVSDELASAIMDAIPDTIAKEMYEESEIDDIADKDNYRVRFVFLQATPKLPAAFADLKDEDVSAVEINQNSYVQFYKKDGEKFSPDGGLTDVLIKDPMMYGAIFAGDADMYNCNTEKAYTRLRYVAEIYKERVNVLKGKHEEIERTYPSGVQGICISSFYHLDEFEGLISGAQSRDVNLIKSGAETIQTRNEILEGGGCPLIY